MQKQILFTGLKRPSILSEGSLHVPFIEVKPCVAPEVTKACRDLDSYTDLLFTSQSAVHFFLQQFEKIPHSLPTLYTVGVATAQALEVHGYAVSHIAREETAEGVVKLLQENLASPAHLFWPHSAGARPVISNYLKSAQHRATETILYQTLCRRPNPLPDLSTFEAIQFTSPSTVDAFFACYHHLPPHLTLFAIGPVTAAALARYGYFANVNVLQASSSSS